MRLQILYGLPLRFLIFSCMHCGKYVFSISGFVMGFNISLIVKVSVFILVLFCGAFVHVAIFINLCDLSSFYFTYKCDHQLLNFTSHIYLMWFLCPLNSFSTFFSTLYAFSINNGMYLKKEFHFNCLSTFKLLLRYIHNSWHS
jgi:hypothetical protein